MESSLPENIHINAQISHTEDVKTGDKADEIPDSSKNAKARHRVTFTFPSNPFGRRENHNGDGIPPAERRAAERVNLLLPKAASLTGALFFKRPISTAEASSRRRHSYAPQASRDYSRCILDLSVCADDDSEPDDERADSTAAMKEPQIHPLRMHPVEKEEEEPRQHTGTNSIAYIAEALEAAIEPGIASVAETASASVATTTTTTNDSTDYGTEERGNGDDNNTPPPPHSQEEDTSDDDQGSDASSVYSADWFPFRELSQISWRTAGSTPADESLPTTTATTTATAAPKSPYRMGRIRRYGWVEGEPF
ncbi:hypothetical protein EMCG_08158 [[Emmonsia] crescens]|uniref:Uncharacterized protein n=1 Tax=[Emmonsia] crescens TaxID=73230 RepID=A0A0G2I6J3_9EURO|nr:hypothetical protein EMCG_08158 [Emmonsia crescens UAMH 3008]